MANALEIQLLPRDALDRDARDDFGPLAFGRMYFQGPVEKLGPFGHAHDAQPAGAGEVLETGWRIESLAVVPDGQGHMRP